MPDDVTPPPGRPSRTDATGTPPLAPIAELTGTVADLAESAAEAAAVATAARNRSLATLSAVVDHLASPTGRRKPARRDDLARMVAPALHRALMEAATTEVATHQRAAAAGDLAEIDLAVSQLRDRIGQIEQGLSELGRRHVRLRRVLRNQREEIVGDIARLGTVRAPVGQLAADQPPLPPTRTLPTLAGTVTWRREQIDRLLSAATAALTADRDVHLAELTAELAGHLAATPDASDGRLLWLADGLLSEQVPRLPAAQLPALTAQLRVTDLDAGPAAAIRSLAGRQRQQPGPLPVWFDRGRRWAVTQVPSVALHTVVPCRLCSPPNERFAVVLPGGGSAAPSCGPHCPGLPGRR